MWSRFKQWHEGEVLLGLVRLLALILALVLFFLFSGVRPFIIPDYYIISLAVVYSVLRISFPSYWYNNNSILAYSIVAGDIAVCCFLPLVSGGLHSPFILYPLTAILSFSLYFKQSLAYFVALSVTSSVIASEVISWQKLNNQQYFSGQVFIALLVVYTIIAFLIAWLPYIANLNLAASIKKKTIVEERSRISRELHDSLAQRLGSLILKLDVLRDTVKDANKADALNQIAKIKHDTQGTYLEVREIIDQLRVKMPESSQIMAALAEYTQDFCHNTGIECKLYLADGHADLQPLAAVEILRIVQEALNNVKKHSGANEIEVKFESTTADIKVIIKDNGKGFIPALVKGQHGLTVMKERAESIGGKFDIVTNPGQGTSIEVTIPANSLQ